jgi:hypothetical protein
MPTQPAGFSSLASQASSMASLSQAARKKQLRIARNILFLLGVVKIVISAYFFSTIDAKVNENVQQQVQHALQRGKIMGKEEIAQATERAKNIERIIWGVAGAMGGVFVFFGLMVKRYPVPITVSSLLLYLLTTAVFGIIEPLSLMEVLFFKIFAVFALMRSVQAAFAYQRMESSTSPDADRVDFERATSAAIVREEVAPQAKPSATQTAPETEPSARPPRADVNFHFKHEFSKLAGLFGFVAICLLALGLVSDNKHLLLLALFPWMLAVGGWFFRPPRLAGLLGSSGITIEHPPQQIRYENIECVTLADSSQDISQPYLIPGPLVLLHTDGCLRLPMFGASPSVYLYRELFARIPAGGSTQVPAELESYRQRETAAFDPQAVFCYRARRYARCGPATGFLQGRALLRLLCGIIWLAGGVYFVAFCRKNDFEPWLFFGVALIIVSFLQWLFYVTKQGRLKPTPLKYRDAGLVISPAGICLKQEDLVGFLHWKELRSVLFHSGSKSFTISSADNKIVEIDLVVDGAVIRLVDIYDRPLPTIKAIINHYYWRSCQ